MTNTIVTTSVNVTGAPVTNTVANDAEKLENFNGENFKWWQPKMFFYLTILNLSRFLRETASQNNKLAYKNTYAPDSAKPNIVKHVGSSLKSNSKRKGKDKRKNDKKSKGKASSNCEIEVPRNLLQLVTHNGEKLYMGNSATVDIKGEGDVILKITFDKEIKLTNVFKDEAIDKFVLYKTKVENQLGKKIKVVQSNRGGKYVSPFIDLYVKHGIRHKFTAPYSPQQNGITKRKNRTLKEIVNAMLISSSLSQDIWGEAIITATYLLNKIPCKKKEEAPYELWMGRKPSYQYLRVWGCLANVVVPNPRPKSNKNMIKSTKNMLKSKFDIKDMGLADVILGIKIIRTQNRLMLSQEHYVDKILNTHNEGDSGLARTPIDTSLHLSKNRGVGVVQLEFSRIIGMLMYLMIGTRPDLAYVVSSSRDYGLHYDRYHAVIEGYNDANWIYDIKDSRSTSGYVFTLGGGTISWKYSKQIIIAKSTMDSEFTTLDKCVEEAKWLCQFVEDIPRSRVASKEIVGAQFLRALAEPGCVHDHNEYDYKDLTSLVNLPKCSCKNSEKLKEHNHLIKLMQFLMGLDDVYAPIRSIILTSEPIPDVKGAFATLSRDESNRDTQSQGGSKSSSGSKDQYTVSSNSFTDEQYKRLMALISEKFRSSSIPANVADVSHLNMTVDHPNGTKASDPSGTGSENNGLYFLNTGKRIMNDNTKTCSLSKCIWHNRLGHPSDHVLNILKDKLGSKNKDYEMSYKSTNNLNFFESNLGDNITSDEPCDDQRDNKSEISKGIDPELSGGTENTDDTRRDEGVHPDDSAPAEAISSSEENATLDDTEGFNQKEGIDYEETFSPVVKIVIVRCILTLSIQNSWPIYQLDINNAFLYRDLVEYFYMSLPEGYFDKNDKRVCKLVKYLYGLKQGLSKWNEKLTYVLIENGFVQSKNDFSLFTKSKHGVFIALLVYVDDIIVTGNNLNEINAVKDFLRSKFLIKDLGKFKYFLGIKVLDSNGNLYFTQIKYCMDVLFEFGLLRCKPCGTPIETKDSTAKAREKVSNGVVKTMKVKSADNVADIFTKGLTVQDHIKFYDQLGLFDMYKI
uniref:Ribonuclease H-like domain-containing protein n=1 Tax=Tanacetum cinerariifolium TaxID=118510 RepID=A0A6L2NSG6_TANCI|nr:ribonuclease H-like domain-containing protein [Tanacetum cinerariifolium]